MANYLITGVAGTGKSTICEELIRLGYRAVDADGATYAHWVERATGKSFPSRPKKGKDWANKYDWNWRTEVMNPLLQTDSGDLFICGVSNNRSDFYPMFKQIFLLRTTPEIITDRLTHRDNNPFGKGPKDIEQILAWQPQFDQELLDQGAVAIDAGLPIPKIIQEILGDDS